MEAEDVISLLDFCWFNLEILRKQSPTSNLSFFEPYPYVRIHKNPSKFSLSRTPAMLVRFNSDEWSSKATTSFGSDLPSPISVLLKPSLRTILSGKEAKLEESISEPILEARKEPKRKEVATRRRSNTMKGLSKSLSDLEFEELKGFMDLGFVFSEEDRKDSNLIEIVPGLQRLGLKKSGNQEEEEEEEEESGIVIDECSIPRPYLSEAWGAKERREKLNDNPLMNWKIPALSNEINMKDSLRWWAHTVASTVG